MDSLVRLRKNLLVGLLDVIDPRRRRILAWRAMESAGIRSMIFERDGVLWDVRLNDQIGWDHFVENGYHRAELDSLIEWMKRARLLAGSRNIVVDVGANIGTTCVALAKKTGCRALAIEPTRANFCRLRKNIELNALSDRILVARKAVTTRQGTLTMHLTSDNSGGHFVARSGQQIPDVVEEHEEVDGDTLDAVIADAGYPLGEIALVWADVQGCELDVIESGAELWRRGVPLWAEVEPLSLRRQNVLPIFAETAARHFDRFIDARELMRLGDKASPVPIEGLPALIAGITPEQINSDVLFLPRSPGFGML